LVLPGVGDGTFGSPVTEASFRYGLAIGAGYLNSDGEEDIVIEGDEIATVLMNNGAGNPMSQTSHVTDGVDTDSPQSVAVADLDGDGNPDRLIRDSGRLLDQEADQGLQQRLTALSGVVSELEESQIQGQLLLRYPPVGTQPRPEQ
jgi:hypothetical protein